MCYRTPEDLSKALENILVLPGKPFEIYLCYRTPRDTSEALENIVVVRGREYSTRRAVVRQQRAWQCLFRVLEAEHKESLGLTTDSTSVLVQCWKQEAGHCCSIAGQRQTAKCQATRLKQKGSSGQLLNWWRRCCLSSMSSPSSALLSVTSSPSLLFKAPLSGTSSSRGAFLLCR